MLLICDEIIKIKEFQSGRKETENDLTDREKHQSSICAMEKLKRVIIIYQLQMYLLEDRRRALVLLIKIEIILCLMYQKTETVNLIIRSSKKDEIICCLTEQSSLRKVITFQISYYYLHAQSHEKRSVKKPLLMISFNASIEKHSVIYKNKVKNIVQTSEFILNAMIKTELLRDCQLTEKRFSSRFSKKLLNGMKKLISDKLGCIIFYVDTNDINNSINSLNAN